MSKKKNKKRSKKYSQTNNNKLQQNTPLSQEHSPSHDLPIIPIKSESIDSVPVIEQRNCANTTTKSDPSINSRPVQETKDAHQQDETINKTSFNSKEVANATPVAETLPEDHSAFNYAAGPIQPTQPNSLIKNDSNSTFVENTIEATTENVDTQSSQQLTEKEIINASDPHQPVEVNNESNLPPNATRVKETKDAHPGYKPFTEYFFETYVSNNNPLEENQNIADEQSAKTNINSNNTNHFTNTEKTHHEYNFLDIRPIVRYDHNGVLYIYNQPILSPNNTHNSAEESTLYNENPRPFEQSNDHLVFTPLNCYENFIPNIKLSETYKTAKEIVENFEELFKPQTFGDNLVIWQNGVDKLLFIDDLKNFIKGQYFLSFSNMEKPAPEIKMCCETILYNMKTKYKKYSSTAPHHILCKNGHFDIHYDCAIDNPKILPNDYDIDNIRCRYRINANLQLPKNNPQFSMYDFLSLSPTKPSEFDKFICFISNGIPAIMLRIWEMIGSLLVPDDKCRAIFLLQGEPSSGKSILGKIISRLFDSEYVSNLNMSQLGNNTASKVLIDKQLNISLDLPNDVIPPAAISFLKQMTGRDLNSSSLDENSNNTFGHCKFLFATNHPLTIKGIDTAFAERIVCIPFYKNIPKQFQDPYLYDKLEKELDYIATKATFFYRLLVASNYVYAQQGYEPFQANITTLSCVSDEDNIVVKNFAAACCVFGPHKVYTQDLYSEYLQYCRFNNIIPIEKANAFSRVFKKCFDSCITSAKWRSDNNSALNGFRGVTIKSHIGTKDYQPDDDYTKYNINYPPSNPYDTSYDNNIDDIVNTSK